jgi:hypothetical protein
MTQHSQTGSGKPSATVSAGGGEFAPPADTLEAYGFDPRKTWPFMAMLLVLCIIAIARVALYGMGESWLPTIVLLAFPIIALVMVGQELRMRGPIIIIAERGLLDRRHGPDFVPWDAISEAEIKRRPFIRGIRIKLTSGERYDLELTLLRVEPLPLMQSIRERAARATGQEL